MTAADIADHLDQLHLAKKFGADDLYISSKVPFGYNVDFVNQYDKRESVIALPFPISAAISIISGIPASTLRLVGNDEIGLRALSVLRGAQGDTAAGIV